MRAARAQAVILEKPSGVSDESYRIRDLCNTINVMWQKDELAFIEALNNLQSALQEGAHNVSDAFAENNIDEILVECVNIGAPFRAPALGVLRHALRMFDLKKTHVDKLLLYLNNILRFCDSANLELSFQCMIALASRGCEYAKALKPHVLLGLTCDMILSAEVPAGPKHAAIELLGFFKEFDIAREDRNKMLHIIQRDDLIDPAHRLLLFLFLLNHVDGVPQIDSQMILELIYTQFECDSDTGKVAALNCLSALLEKGVQVNVDFVRVFSVICPEHTEVSCAAFDVLAMAASHGQAEGLLGNNVMELILGVLNGSFPLATRIACVRCLSMISVNVPRRIVEEMFRGANLADVLIDLLGYGDRSLVVELFKIFDVVLNETRDENSWFLEKFRERDGWELIDDLMRSENVEVASAATIFYHRYQNDDDALLEAIDEEPFDD